MSLVDYASSDEDEAAEVGEEGEEETHHLKAPKEDVPEEYPLPRPLPRNQSELQSTQKTDIVSDQSEPSVLKLPDASQLFNSPTMSSHLVNGSDHSSRVAAAMAENASRKRESNGLASSCPRSKLPRGTLPHSRSVPDTGGGLLVPPQLSGR
ncbi:unnamed protein product [Ilex paraguariensis]|uniref:Uncharacterized protein n=1 Tax=Ilex paraguariensis TaxID=185542 RepID=A0ABC8RZP9_9AQUA